MNINEKEMIDNAVADIMGEVEMQVEELEVLDEIESMVRAKLTNIYIVGLATGLEEDTHSER